MQSRDYAFQRSQTRNWRNSSSRRLSGMITTLRDQRAFSGFKLTMVSQGDTKLLCRKLAARHLPSRVWKAILPSSPISMATTDCGLRSNAMRRR